ncbi:MAG: XdhC family protein [Actinobacteria bacterium]|nr:XdhC family protein [Actinomycetota bacterium]
MATVHEAFEIWDAWSSVGDSVAVATVVRVAGSAPRPEGSRFLVSSAGEMSGSVSGGCVENDVYLHATSVLEGGGPLLVTYGIADEEAFEVGLACGGTIQVFVARMGGEVDAAARDLVRGARSGSLATVVAGPAIGQSVLLDEHGTVVAGSIPEEIGDDVGVDAVRLADTEQAVTLSYHDHDVFIETVAPPPMLVIWGADEVAVSLSAMARRAGFRVTLCDPRPAFTVPERFPDAERVVVGWPDDIAGQVTIDHRTYVVSLTHDGRVEGPLLPTLLASPARYIGAMGSRRTHAKRVERLAAQGWDSAAIDRIHGPVGLDIGAERPAEVAVSILAEMIAARYRSGSGEALRGTEGRIHRQRPGEADV